MPGIEVRTPGKRVRIEYLLDLGSHLFALLENRFQAVRESGQHDVRRGGAATRDLDTVLPELRALLGDT